MATFVYKAIDAEGRQVADTLVAADRAAAIEQLFGKSLSPVSVERQEEHHAGGVLARSGRVSKGEVEAFTRQLANLLAAGVPLSRALNILSREASKPATAKLWATVHDQVAGGMSLADALGQHPRVFSPVYVAMVRAGRDRRLPRSGAGADRHVPVPRAGPQEQSDVGPAVSDDSGGAGGRGPHVPA